MACWRPVLNFEGYYEVSEEGEVRSLDREVRCFVGGEWHTRISKGKPIKGKQDTCGYRHYELSKHNKKYSVRGHTIVLEAFVCAKPKGMEACHGNGIRTDNRLSNLRWDTRANNYEDARIHNTASVKEKHGMSKLTKEDVSVIKGLRHSSRMSFSKIGKLFEISRSHAASIVRGKYWKKGE